MSGRQHYGLASTQEGLSTSPRRRQHAVQPPSLLTTTLGNAHISSHGVGPNPQTPISTTSLSSPFSVHQASPYPSSPASTLRGSSPMALRSSSSFNAAYNPQQWGTMNSNGLSNSRSAVTTAGQSGQGSRLAHGPVGPDGVADSHLRVGIHMLIDHLPRTRCISTTAVLSPPGSNARGYFSAIIGRSLARRHGFPRFKPISLWYSCERRHNSLTRLRSKTPEWAIIITPLISIIY